jgi:hypothetical protein
MIDGILDLLSAILILAIVVAIAFGFILPLAEGDYLYLDSSYNDKAIGSVSGNYEVDKNISNADLQAQKDMGIYYSDFVAENRYGVETRKRYSYDELVLLLAVQDSRMDDPKGLNIRNLVKNGVLIGNTYNQSNLNEVIMTGDKALQTAKYYSINNTDLITGNYSTDPTKKNVGTLDFSGDYLGDINDVCRIMSISDLASDNAIDLKEKPKNYFIEYHFAVPDDNKYVKKIGNSNYLKNWDDEEMYMVHVDNDFGVVDKNKDTLYIYRKYLTEVKNKVKGGN